MTTAPWAPGRAAGLVSSWDVSTGVDGPGTRLVVFISGCPLRCVYCQNPETWEIRNGRTMTVADVLAELAKYERFIRVAGGGFTVSGGKILEIDILADPARLRRFNLPVPHT